MKKARLSAAIVSLAVLAAAACSKKEEAPAASATGDTSVPAMDHAQMAKRDLPPAKDADHDFLRTMADHHEGLIWMTDQAQKKGTAAGTRQDAARIYQAQIAARDSMLKIITAAYSETHKAEPMGEDLVHNDSLAATASAAYDKKFYQTLVKHHREGLDMINAALPKLTRPDVKSLVEKMKSEHESDLKSFQAKAGA